MIRYNTKDVQKYVTKGDKVFIIIRHKDTFEWCVLEDTVGELHNVVVLSDQIVKKYNLTSSTAWWYTDENTVSGYVKPTPDNKWGFIKLPFEALENGEVVNQLIFTQEYTKGHGEILGDGIWLTKEEAQKYLELDLKGL